jgi:hypothetical protein
VPPAFGPAFGDRLKSSGLRGLGGDATFWPGVVVLVGLPAPVSGVPALDPVLGVVVLVGLPAPASGVVALVELPGVAGVPVFGVDVLVVAEAVPVPVVVLVVLGGEPKLTSGNTVTVPAT